MQDGSFAGSYRNDICGGADREYDKAEPRRSLRLLQKRALKRTEMIREARQQPEHEPVSQECKPDREDEAGQAHEPCRRPRESASRRLEVFG
jgi:hypothetical protein